jgi:hypothetical protein
MHVLFIGIWITVSDYNTNPAVIILVGMNLNEMHVLIFDIWMTVSDYTTKNYSFYFLISG